MSRRHKDAVKRAKVHRKVKRKAERKRMFAQLGETVREVELEVGRQQAAQLARRQKQLLERAHTRRLSRRVFQVRPSQAFLPTHGIVKWSPLASLCSPRISHICGTFLFVFALFAHSSLRPRVRPCCCPRTCPPRCASWATASPCRATVSAMPLNRCSAAMWCPSRSAFASHLGTCAFLFPSRLSCVMILLLEALKLIMHTNSYSHYLMSLFVARFSHLFLLLPAHGLSCFQSWPQGV